MCKGRGEGQEESNGGAERRRQRIARYAMSMLMESCGKEQGLCRMDVGANDGEGLGSQGDPRRDRGRVICLKVREKAGGK